MSDKKHINFEEEAIEDGFVPSEAYLNTLESSLFETLDIEEKLLTKKDGFSTTEAYLDGVEKDIFSRLESEEENSKTKKSVFKIQPAALKWMAAASIVAFISIISFNSFDEKNEAIDFASLTFEEEQYFLNQHALFLNDDELGYILSDQVFEIEIKDEHVQQELEDYLILNEVYPLETYK